MSKIGNKKINKVENPSQYKVGAYIRTATASDGQLIIKFQEDRVKEFCDDMKLQIVDWYIDEGFNGLDSKRPSYNKLIDDIKGNKINMIVTANLARISRSRRRNDKIT